MKNKEQEQKITDISIHIASLSASFKPAPDALILERILVRSRFIKPCLMPVINTRTVLVHQDWTSGGCSKRETKYYCHIGGNCS